MGLCTNLARTVLIVTGICYLVSAGALCYIGVWVFSTYSNYDEIADSTLTLVPASIIVGVSVFMCVIGILSCLAAFRKSKLLLSIFFCLILLVFLGEVGAGTLGYLYRSKAEGILQDDLKEAIDNYNETIYKDQIDFLQDKFHCCGIHNYTDWLDSQSWTADHKNAVPLSCCQHLGNQTDCNLATSTDKVYKEGCLDKLDDEFKSNLLYIIITVICLAAIQILALVSTCALVCRSRDPAAYQTLGEPIGGGLRV